jgi:hypothetical protein
LAAWGVAWLLLSAAASAFAQPAALPLPPSLPMPSAKLAPGESIPLDGSLSHPAWQRAPVYNSFIEREPTLGAAPGYETRVQVLVGDHALYVGITALDPKPELIQALPVRHDQADRTHDFVIVYIDTMGRKKMAQWFGVTAAGSTMDGVNTAEDDNEDNSPDFDYDAAVQRNAQGYTAVLRIPYSSLRYSKTTGANPTAGWRMMVLRRVPRDQPYLLMSVPLGRDAANFIEALQPLQGAPTPSNDSFLQLRPNFTLRHSTDQQPGQPATADNMLNVGLDIKWRPRPELVVDATLKPDFSQVELDVPQLSRNTRFALYLQEKRPFFLESSDLLRSPTDALYTRSISQPRWGVRASWRDDGLAATTYATHDLGGGLVLLPGPYGTGTAPQPASDGAVARFRLDSADLSWGGIASLRRYDAGLGENAVAGPDVSWQATPNLRLRAQLLASHTTALPDALGQLTNAPAQDGTQLFASAFWRATPYEAGAVVEDRSLGFRNDNGFVTQTGVRRLELDAHRVWRNTGPFNEIWLNLNTENIQDRATGHTISSQVTPGFYFSTSHNTEFTLEYRGLSRQRVAADTALQQEHYWHGSFTRNLAQWAPKAEIDLDHGHLMDVTANQVRPGSRLTLLANLRPLRALEVLPNYSLAQLQAPAGGQAYRETAAQLLAIWHLAPQQTLRLILQRNGADRLTEPALQIVGFNDRERTQSLTYIWRRSAGSIFYLGASRGDSGVAPLDSHGTELFAKLQLDVDEWFRR